jgi:rhodanese-related sulfurtransferase
MFGMKKGSSEFDLDSRSFEAALQEAENAVLLDVRTPPEYAEGHLAGSRNIDLYGASFQDQIAGLDKERPTFVYCRSGSRSAHVAGAMRQMGFASVYNLRDGIIKWHGDIEH